METLRGRLLVAGPGLLDPNFRRTVVLVGEHTADGAMGVVLNRPSVVSVGEAVPLLEGIVDGGEPVHVGGPVEPEGVVVLAEFADPGQAAALVFGNVGFLPAALEEEDLAGLGRARIFAGYSGWAPGQLEGELAEEAWIVADAVADDVFGGDRDGLWSTVLRRLGGRYALVATMPADPGLN